MLRRSRPFESCIAITLLACLELFPSLGGAQTSPAAESLDLNMYQQIRDEGFRHSHIMEYASGMFDGIGPRLTGSPNMKKANEWTRDQLNAMGCSNAHLEDWGEFGMGWQQRNTWLRMVAPDMAVFITQAVPWSPATSGAVTAPLIAVDVKDEKDLSNTRESWPAKWCCWARRELRARKTDRFQRGTTIRGWPKSFITGSPTKTCSRNMSTRWK